MRDFNYSEDDEDEGFDEANKFWNEDDEEYNEQMDDDDYDEEHSHVIDAHHMVRIMELELLEKELDVKILEMVIHYLENQVEFKSLSLEDKSNKIKETYSFFEKMFIKEINKEGESK